MLETNGISPKAILAALLPALADLPVVVAHWIVTGEFNRTEWAILASGLVASLLAFAGAYVGKPGAVMEIASSDALMDAEAARRLRTQRGHSLVEIMAACFLALLCVVVLFALIEPGRF